jgi:hypothetical protein
MECPGPGAWAIYVSSEPKLFRAQPAIVAQATAKYLDDPPILEGNTVDKVAFPVGHFDRVMT